MTMTDNLASLIRAYLPVCMRTYINTYIHTCAHNMHARIHVINTCDAMQCNVMHTHSQCMHAYVKCICKLCTICAHMRAYLFSVQTYKVTCILTNLYNFADLFTSLHAFNSFI